ncbi:MAG: hypothetical protein GXZ05_09575 [Gammaproteobacteria bacterium]|nr:hypothetical protein [Gammaproteobacteria bacterium]
MTTNKPEVVAWYFPSSKTTLPVVSLNARNGNGQSLIRLSDYEALQAECEKLRTCLAETAGVAVTMLYESHKADTIKEFTVEQLSQMVETTKHLADANIQVEKVYRKAWSMAHGCDGADWGGSK